MLNLADLQNLLDTYHNNIGNPVVYNFIWGIDAVLTNKRIESMEEV